MHTRHLIYRKDDFSILSLAQPHALTVLLCCAIFTFNNMYSLEMIPLKSPMTLTVVQMLTLRNVKCQEGVDIQPHRGEDRVGLVLHTASLLLPCSSVLCTAHGQPAQRERHWKGCALPPVLMSDVQSRDKHQKLFRKAAE